MKANKKAGFTLVETVVCVAIIGIITLGFLYLTGGSAAIFKNGVQYDRDTSALVSAAQTGVMEEGMTDSIIPDKVIYLSSETSIQLDRVTITASTGSVYYYTYNGG